MANQNLQISGKITDEKIDNTLLVDAINEMRKQFSADTQNKVINAALRSTFLVPAVLEKNQELVADADNHVSFQDRQTAKFLLINKAKRDENGKEIGVSSYFPIFTSAEELKKIKTEQAYKPFAMKFSDVANLTENTPNVEGFVINPFTAEHNLPFTKPMLNSIKQTLIKFKQDRDAAAKAAAENGEGGAPDITVSSSEDK